MLLTLFATQINEAISKSITGDKFAFVLPSFKGMNNDLLPANSFVSFISEATIFVVSNLWFWLNGIDTAFPTVVVVKDVSVPLGDVPVVGCIVGVIEVLGNSDEPIIVLIVSYL